MRLNQISGEVVDAAIRIHMKLGPGLFESVYEGLLVYELEKRGLKVKRQVPIPVVYDQIKMPDGFRADLIVEGSLLVELKSLEQLAPVHYKQVLTYLRCANIPLGLLLNFGEEQMKNGIKRVVNNLREV